MSREIKFRAWANKKMLPVAVLDVARQPSYYFKPFEGWSKEHDDSPITGRVINRDDTDFVLMQYTGLKDKNVREVWEGDIGVYYFGLEKRVGYIRYYAGRWIVDSNPPRSRKVYIGADLADIYDGILWDSNDHPFEVIGNIYENAELLKGDTKL